ncbi:polysaccharide biosynthesis C-terminal domain-containing protein [Pseudoxanthomonas sp. PXM02]|uniref:lipopolysaccharide biosynthesis protein n=1 Tax=Pseudoxanthomonas sp. PXM02 TaxID=2769294 RepID=UPI0017876BE3|nr:polysaccharide biosynthesis C-terminal domain-containing protein [Pseudoxanthomonas sp. PXM02]MBD9478922.1 polysaccharide biosynthesis C-terminal domain-containing protein [Pseudoxanthomonas sp. PXM02]
MSQALPMPWRPALAALSVLSLATAAGAAMVFLTQVLLARHFGPAQYGLFASSLATVSLVAPLAGFGLSQFRLKAHGAEGWAAERWQPASARFIVVTSALAVGGVVAWALAGPPVDAETRYMLLVLAPFVLGLLAVEQTGSKLRLEERHAALAGWQLLVPAGRLAIALLAVAGLSLSIHAVAWGHAALAALVLVLALPQWRAMQRGDWTLKGHGPRNAALSHDIARPDARTLLRHAWPYGVAAVLYPVFFQIGTVLLKYLHGDAEAGVFGIALAVMTAIYLFPTTVYQKFLLARLHRWAVHDRARFRQVYRLGCVGMLASGVAVGLLLAALSGHAVQVFGDRYAGLQPLLMLLAVCVPVRFLSTAVGAVLLTEGQMLYRVGAMLVAAVAAILLNLLLIPSHGAMGAAFATLAAEGLLLLSMYHGARRATVLRGAP